MLPVLSLCTFGLVLTRETIENAFYGIANGCRRGAPLPRLASALEVEAAGLERRWARPASQVPE